MPEAKEYLRVDGASPFRDALVAFGDPTAKARVDTTVRKLGRGLRPDVKPVGEGVFEARIDYGPGYRVYFGLDGPELVILLACGDKATQAEDISNSHAYWADYRKRKKAPPPREGQPAPPPLHRPVQ